MFTRYTEVALMWTSKMWIDGRPIEIEDVVVSFSYSAEDGAYLNFQSDSENPKLGGLALNGIHAGNVPSLGELFGRKVVVDREEQPDAELAESVMWAPGGGHTLELDRVEILLKASLLKCTVEYEISATCFDDVRSGIQAAISGQAPIQEELTAFIERESPHIRDLWAKDIGARSKVYGVIRSAKSPYELKTTGGNIFLKPQNESVSQRCRDLVGRYVSADVEKQSSSFLKSRQKWQLVRIDPIDEIDLR
jgi:hypothetical protein